MSDDPGNEAPEEMPDLKPKRGSLSWYQAWSRVMANPSVVSFEIILDDPRAGTWRGLRWLFFPMAIGIFLVFIGIQILLESLNPDSLLPALYFSLILGAVYTISTAFFAVCVHLIARLLNGTGTYGETLYAFAAFLPVVFFIEIALAFLTGQPLFFLAIRLYRIVLLALAVRAVHRLPWWKTGAALVIGAVVAQYAGNAILLLW